MGKSNKTGKLIWSAIGFGLGMAFLGPVAGSVFQAGLMGASLFGTVWLAINNKQQQNNDSGSASVTRFGRAQETMSSNGAIPVVYGLRKVSGNQTYHLTNADANTLHKHVVLCEGGIKGIQGVTANDLLIPGNSLGSDTVFTIQNVKYYDARVWKNGKTLYLHCNGNTKSIYLCNKDDFTNEDAEYWEWQTSVSALISYINRLNQGWQCFPIATTSKYPGDLSVADAVKVSTKRVTSAPRGTHYELNKVYHLGNGVCVQAMTQKDCETTNQPYNLAMDGTCHLWLGMGQCIWEWTESISDGACYKNPVRITAARVTGGTKYTFYDGSLPSNYKEVGAYPQMAWIDMTCCVADELSGNPSVACEVFGKQIYDTRTKTTAYSTNPAMCLRDFLLSPVYGLGNFVSTSDLDEDSFKESADYCDELVPFQTSDGIMTGKRYELNIVIDSRRNAWDWVSDILASFSGFLVISQGKLMLKIERKSPIVYAFDETNCSELKISPIELEQVPNRYEITFIDPLNNWDSVKAIVEDSADQHTRGKIITKDVQLEGVTSQNQALRLARFYRDYNASCIINVSFKTGYQALHLQPGDVVKLTYKCFTDFPIRINEIRESADGVFEITGRQYNDSIYNDTIAVPIQAYNYATKDIPLGAPPEVANLRFEQYFFTDAEGTVHQEIQGTWDVPQQYGFVKEFSVYKKDSEGRWNQLLRTTGTSFKTGVVIGETVEFKVCVANTNDALSTGIESGEIIIDGTDYPPADVTGLAVEYENGKLHISWDANVELDFKQYVLTINDYVLTTSDTSCEADAVDGENTISIRAEDYGGNLSDTASTMIQLELSPSRVMGFNAKNFGNYIVLTWNESERALYYKIDGSTSKNVYGGCSLLIPIKTAGMYSYNIRAVNKYGESDVSTTSVSVSSIEERHNIMTVNLLNDITCDEVCEVTPNGTLVLI